MRYSRIDAGRLAKAQRTPQGGIRVDAVTGVSRVLAYSLPDGSVRREWISPEELSKADSIASLASAPVTRLHPQTMVSPATYKRDAVGHVEANAFDPKESLLVSKLVVQDGYVVDEIDSGKLSECSLAYECHLDMTPGTTPSGEHYDAIQRDRVYNHVGLGPPGWARAGRQAALRLDAAGHQITDAAEPREQKTMNIDGIDYKVGEANYEQAIEKYVTHADGEVKAARADAEKAAGELVETRKQLDAATAKVAELQARQDAADAEAKLAPARADALVVMGTEAKLDGLTLRQIHEAALVKSDAEAKFDGLTDDFVAGLFAGVVRAAKSKNPSLEAVRKDAAAAKIAKPVGGVAEAEAATAKARADMIERSRNAWKTETK